MDDYQDQCLICGLSGSEKLQCLAEDESAGMVFSELQVIFTLRNILEVPRSKLEGYLVQWGSPSEWRVSVCDKCRGAVINAKRIYQEILESTRIFKAVKREIIEVVKKSYGRRRNDGRGSRREGITGESREFVYGNEYGAFTDPFLEGDEEATKAGKEVRKKLKTITRSVIKTEPSNDGEGFGRSDLDFDPGNYSEVDSDDDEVVGQSNSKLSGQDGKKTGISVKKEPKPLNYEYELPDDKLIDSLLDNHVEENLNCDAVNAVTYGELWKSGVIQPKQELKRVGRGRKPQNTKRKAISSLTSGIEDSKKRRKRPKRKTSNEDEKYGKSIKIRSPYLNLLDTANDPSLEHALVPSENCVGPIMRKWKGPINCRCGKSYQHANHLARHIRIEKMNPEDKFFCEYCEKAEPSKINGFRAKEDLKRHIQYVHQGFKSICHYCGITNARHDINLHYKFCKKKKAFDNGLSKSSC